MPNIPLPPGIKPPGSQVTYKLARQARQENIHRLDEQTPVENKTRIDFEPSSEK